MAVEFKTVDIWIGKFPSRQRLDAFFEEVFDPGNDDKPISEFAKAMHESYYDHDFVERQFYNTDQTVGQLLTQHSFSKSYIESALKAATDLGVCLGNTTVLVWDGRITQPVSTVGEMYSLNYLGCFECDPSVG